MDLLIVISWPEHIFGETEMLIQLFEAGLDIFHLRKPEFTILQMEEYILSVPTIWHNHIVLHSHYELAVQFQLKGIHLTEKTKHTPKTEAFWQRMEGKSISASFHNIEEIKRLACHYDYIFLSPVFDSISKTGYHSSFSEDELRKLCCEMNARPHPVPIIGLGGIDGSNVSKLKSYGLSGAALLGAVWQQPNPVKAFCAIRDEMISSKSSETEDK